MSILLKSKSAASLVQVTNHHPADIYNKSQGLTGLTRAHIHTHWHGGEIKHYLTKVRSGQMHSASVSVFDF